MSKWKFDFVLGTVVGVVAFCCLGFAVAFDSQTLTFTALVAFLGSIVLLDGASVRIDIEKLQGETQ